MRFTGKIKAVMTTIFFFLVLENFKVIILEFKANIPRRHLILATRRSLERATQAVLLNEDLGSTCKMFHLHKKELGALSGMLSV